VKVKYGEERFCTFLIKDITLAKLMQEIKRNCSPLAHLPDSNIRVCYRDEDGGMFNNANIQQCSTNNELISLKICKLCSKALRRFFNFSFLDFIITNS